MTKLICKLMRPSTESYLKVEIPEEIGPHQEDWINWISQEFNAQFTGCQVFIPTDFYLSDANGDRELN